MATIFKDSIEYEVAGETIVAGQALYKSLGTGTDSGRTAGRMYKLDVSNPDRDVFYGIAKTGGNAGDTIKVVTSGRVDAFSGLTAGTVLYADSATPGGYVTTAPSSNIQVLGVAKDADSLLVNAALGGSFISSLGGSGAQIPDVFVQLTGSELLSTWATGDNSTFLGGGTLSGTFAYETTSPLNGTQSYKYTQAAGSLNDYVASPVQSVPIRFRGNYATLYFPYTYNGTSSDIEPILYDVTNSAKLTTSTNLLPATETTGSIYKVNVLIPSTCTQIRVGFHVKSLSSGSILQFDDVQVSADTTQYADPSTITEWQAYTPTTQGFGTITNVDMQWRRVGSDIEIRGKFTSGTVTASEARIGLPSGYTSVGSPSIGSIQVCGKVVYSIASAAEYVTLIEPGVTYLTVGSQTSVAAGLTKLTGSSASANSATQSIFAKIPIAGLAASNPMIVTASESFSTDTASLVYASSSSYTLSTLADAPVGTFITFTYAASSNTRTQTTTAPTQTTADMNVNGIRLFARVYASASTAGNPAAIAVQIGKGLKGISLSLYKSTGKTTAGDLESYIIGNDTMYGPSQKNYDEKTGVLYVDVGEVFSSTVNSHAFRFTDLVISTDGYLVVNASKSPALAGVPLLQPRIATLSDVKTSATDGGTFTSGSFQTRTLNTIDDPTGIVISLSSNQFTLPAGEYYIEASAPAYRVGNNIAKLRNITDSTDAILGSSEYNSEAANYCQGRSVVVGKVILATSKTFEIQHRCQNTFATLGFGVSNAFGDNRYTVVKITKVK